MEVAGFEADEKRALAILLAERCEDRGGRREELADDAEAIRRRAEHLFDAVGRVPHRMQRPPELEQERRGVVGRRRVAGAMRKTVGHVVREAESFRAAGCRAPAHRTGPPAAS